VAEVIDIANGAGLSRVALMTEWCVTPWDAL
jgi:hypothetical protein